MYDCVDINKRICLLPKDILLLMPKFILMILQPKFYKYINTVYILYFTKTNVSSIREKSSKVLGEQICLIANAHNYI
jgi:hypothetical protein